MDKSFSNRQKSSIFTKLKSPESGSEQISNEKLLSDLRRNVRVEERNLESHSKYDQQKRERELKKILIDPRAADHPLNSNSSMIDFNQKSSPQRHDKNRMNQMDSPNQTHNKSTILPHIRNNSSDQLNSSRKMIYVNPRDGYFANSYPIIRIPNSNNNNNNKKDTQYYSHKPHYSYDQNDQRSNQQYSQQSHKHDSSQTQQYDQKQTYQESRKSQGNIFKNQMSPNPSAEIGTSKSKFKLDLSQLSRQDHGKYAVRNEHEKLIIKQEQEKQPQSELPPHSSAFKQELIRSNERLLSMFSQVNESQNKKLKRMQQQDSHYSKRQLLSGLLNKPAYSDQDFIFQPKQHRHFVQPGYYHQNPNNQYQQKYQLQPHHSMQHLPFQFLQQGSQIPSAVSAKSIRLPFGMPLPYQSNIPNQKIQNIFQR